MSNGATDARLVSRSELGTLLTEALSGRRVFGSSCENDEVHLRQITPDRVDIPPHRSIEPPKPLFFRTRENLGSYLGDDGTPESEPRALVGATACDLAALKMLDWVFLEGDVVDPYYETLRDSTLVVSVDCTEPKDECFCTWLGRKPYPEGAFDINLSPISDGYVVQIGSERGREAMGEILEKCPAASADHLQQRDQMRGQAEQHVDATVSELGLHMTDDFQERVRESIDLALWEELAEKCVECAACNFICPTCHCFLLADVEAKEDFKRFKNWDACLYEAFALEASGVNPRPRRAARLHGRLEKKFDFLKTNTGDWGCTGCGRCIEACAGEIDMRETIQKITAPEGQKKRTEAANA
ncbi:MAG: 4Fe-4S dicluster domain-containing protein [Candidatus Brocadiia bacterium]